MKLTTNEKRQLKFRLLIIFLLDIPFATFYFLLCGNIETIVNLAILFGFSVLLLFVPNLKSMVIMLVWFILYYLIAFTFQWFHQYDWGLSLTFAEGFYYNKDAIPLLLFSLWPLFGSIFFILLCSLVLSPLFLKVKKLILRKYNNMYIENKTQLDIPFKKIISRAFYTFLLTIGLFSTLYKSGLMSSLFDPRFIYYDEFLLLMISFPLILPFVVGIWAVGWALEDAGIMHYKFSNDKSNFFYEIEPVHYKYNSLIKGYAGISTIIYVIETSIISSGGLAGSLAGVLGQFLVVPYRFSLFLMFIGPFFPAYVLYWLFEKDYLRKNMKRANEIFKIQIMDKENEVK